MKEQSFFRQWNWLDTLHRMSRDKLNSYEIYQLKAKLRRLERSEQILLDSNAYKIGSLFVKAIRHPGWNIFLLPYRLTKLARETAKRRAENPMNADQSPMVSVVMTTWNSASFLDKAVNSILCQTYENLELIVVDDGSDDDTFRKIAAFAEVDDRVVPVKSFRRQGTYWSKNLGITYARGKYITTQDSDDESDSKRISAQVNLLESNPTLLMATVQYDRRLADGTLKLTRGKKTRISLQSLMFRKDETIKEVGYYDSVTVAADAEFYHRFKKKFGEFRVGHIDEAYYHFNARPGSLTHEESVDPGGSMSFRNSIQYMSNNRKLYVESYRRWHNSDSIEPWISFPLRDRTFPAPEKIISNQATQEQYVSACMAVIPSRRNVLRKNLELILNQVDRLYLYLNGWSEVPSYFIHKKIEVITSKEHGDQKDNGKFWFIGKLNKGYVFTLDDDIRYPSDYVQRCILKIEQYGRRAVVGIHGILMNTDNIGFNNRARTYAFYQFLETDTFTHLLGTGTTAWHTDTLSIRREDFDTPGMADIWFSLCARRQSVPFITISRKEGWLQDCAQDKKSLYNESKKGAIVQTSVLRQAGEWPFHKNKLSYTPLCSELFREFSEEELSSREVDTEFVKQFGEV